MKQPVEINIDELILHGFSDREGREIEASVKLELARIFMGNGIPEGIKNGGRLHDIHNGPIRISQKSRPKSIGKQVAETIYNGLKYEPESSNKSKK